MVRWYGEGRCNANNFARLGHNGAMGCKAIRRDGEINEVTVLMNPDVQDGLVLHLPGLGVVRQHFLTVV
jgi:hypothetical protein